MRRPVTSVVGMALKRAAVPGAPRTQQPVSGALHLVRVLQVPGPAADQDAPPPLVAHVDVVDLEGDELLPERVVQLGLEAGPHDHVVPHEGVVHGEDDGAGPSPHGQAPDRAGGQQAEGLRPVEHLEAVAVAQHPVP
jgi:hypothetical protein